MNQYTTRNGTRRRFLNHLAKICLVVGGALGAAGALAGGAATSASAAEDCRLVVLGDSLAAGYGVALEDAFPTQLDRALAAEGIDCEVINAGVSGDTSAGGLSRLAWVLGDEPTHLLVELGGNDALRALPVEQLEANLAAIIERSRDAGASVMLAGMLAPPNLGTRYTEAFADVYTQLGERFDVPLYPFFLAGAIEDPALMLEDGIHPNAAGVAAIVERMLPVVTAWLEQPTG